MQFKLLHVYFIHICSTCNLSWYAQAQLVSNNNGCYSKYIAKDSSWKSLSMVYIFSKEGFQNNMGVTLNMLHKSCRKRSQLAIICFNCLKARMTTLVLWIYVYLYAWKVTQVVLFTWQKTHPRGYSKNSMCYTRWKSKGQISLINKTIYCHIIVKIWMTFIYLRSVYGALRLVEQINVRNKWKKKNNSNWYEAKQMAIYKLYQGDDLEPA